MKAEYEQSDIDGFSKTNKKVPVKLKNGKCKQATSKI